MTTESIDPTQNCVKEAKAMSDNVRKKAEGAPGPHVSVLTPYRKQNDLFLCENWASGLARACKESTWCITFFINWQPAYCESWFANCWGQNIRIA